MQSRLFPVQSAFTFLLFCLSVAAVSLSSASTTRPDLGRQSPSATVRGLSTQAIFDLAIDPINPLSILAVTPTGLMQSTDGGRRWNLVDRQGSAFESNFRQSGAVYIDPSNPRRILATRTDLFLTENGGKSWRRVLLDERPFGGHTVVAAPSDSNVLYAGFAGMGLHRSLDGGSSWTMRSEGLPGPLPFRMVLTLAVHPDNPDIVYAGTAEGLYWTVNGGRFWEFRGQGIEGPQTLPPEGNGGPWILSIAVTPSNPNVIYAGTQRGRVAPDDTQGAVFKSINGGASWTRFSRRLPDLPVNVLLCDPEDSTVVYAGLLGGGVYVSRDSGGTWNLVDEQLDGLFVRSLDFDPLDSNRILVGTNTGLFEVTLEPPPVDAEVTAEQTVTGNFFGAGSVVYSTRLTNTGTQTRNVEFVETVPTRMELNQVRADSGETFLGPSRGMAQWRGSLGPGESVQIDLSARIETAEIEEVFSVQGLVRVDGATSALTEDPNPFVEDAGGATGFRTRGIDLFRNALLAPLPFQPDQFVGVAATHFLNTVNPLVVESRRLNGQFVERRAQDILLPGGEQASFLATDLVSSGDILWLNSRRGEIFPEFLVGDNRLQKLDGLSRRLDDAQTLILPLGGSEDAGRTVMFVFNSDPTTRAAAVLRLIDAQGAVVSTRVASIAPGGGLRTSVRQLFGFQSDYGDGYVRLEAERPLRAFQLLIEDDSLTAQPALPIRPTDRFWAPHYFFGPSLGSTHLRLINPLQRSVNATIRLFDDRVGLIAESQFSLQPAALVQLNLAEIAAQRVESQGYLEVVVDSGELDGRRLNGALAASVTYENADLGFRSSLPLADRPTSENYLIFPHVAHVEEAGILQGVAIAALNDGARVWVQSRTSSGQIYYYKEFNLGRGERVVGLLSELFFDGFELNGGTLEIYSGQPFVAYSLFSGPAFLSAIEGIAGNGF